MFYCSYNWSTLWHPRDTSVNLHTRHHLIGKLGFVLKPGNSADVVLNWCRQFVALLHIWAGRTCERGKKSILIPEWDRIYTTFCALHISFIQCVCECVRASRGWRRGVKWSRAVSGCNWSRIINRRGSSAALSTAEMEGWCGEEGGGNGIWGNETRGRKGG